MSRALVLGGGGPVGIAWEAGLLAGLAEGGVTPGGEADFIVGTSAGSVVGALMALGRDPRELAAAIIAEESRPRQIPGQVAEDRPGAPNMMTLFQKMAEAASGARDPQDVRREIGAFSLEAQTVDEETFISGFGRQLAGAADGAWPAGYACTAVDTATGAFVVWDAAASVPLSRAVASSCSVPGVFSAITIGSARYMDGGMRSATNADLAKGHERTVVVAVRLGEGEFAERMMKPLEAEIAAIEAAGGKAHLIVPDDAAMAAFGSNLMNPRHRPAAAKAGLDQGRALAAEVGAFWG